jgi:hypothetical protein
MKTNPNPKITENRGTLLMERRNGGFITKTTSVNNEERSVIKYVSTPTLDRYNEIVIQEGIDLANFRKNPVVLYAHNQGDGIFGGGYPTLPIAKDLWIKFDGSGLLAKQKYNQTSLATEIFQMHLDGFYLASSIGFMPLEYRARWKYSDEEWAEQVNKLAKDFTLDVNLALQADFIITKSELYEHSDVPVPANPEALTNAFKSGYELKYLAKDFELLKTKSVINALEQRLSVLEERFENDVKKLQGKKVLDIKKAKTQTTSRISEILKNLSNDLDKMSERNSGTL